MRQRFAFIDTLPNMTVLQGRFPGIVLVISSLLLISLPAHAGEFQITPMFVELSRGMKSGTITIGNEGKDKLNFQLSAKEWTQSADGKDQYSETTDIVFFPKIMTVGPGSQQIIRVGSKGPAVKAERTYRLFLTEIVEKDREGARSKQAQVAIVTQISLPVFIKPLQEQERGVADKVEMAKGMVTAVITNTGNVHIQFRTVAARGKAVDGSTLFTKEIPGWYVLAGVSRAYTFPVPADQCPKLSSIEIEALTDTDLKVYGTLNVRGEMCIP